MITEIISPLRKKSLIAPDADPVEQAFLQEPADLVAQPNIHAGKVAWISGIAGQDGSYLAEYLLELGYEVHGIVRRNSVAEHQQTRLDKIVKNIHNVYGDLTDPASVGKAIKNAKPDEIYNLGAQSHVQISFQIPQYTAQVNAIGTLNVLEAMREYAPNARFYQAASSEMFGNSIDPDGFQRETTPMHPVSPYGCAKVFSYNIAKNYRHAYNLFASTGILFNHESARRGSNFVTSKIIKNAVLISLGREKSIHLGNLDSFRDWGHSRDYVRAMHKIVNHFEPDDFVISTGIARSIREFCDITFRKLGLDYLDHIVQDPKFMRPEELKYLKGDSSKARSILGWEPEITFEHMIDEMIDFWKAELTK